LLGGTQLQGQTVGWECSDDVEEESSGKDNGSWALYISRERDA
jgi:hypothetical protein